MSHAAEIDNKGLVGLRIQQGLHGAGDLCAAVVTLLSLYPQLQMWVTGHESWRNAVAYNQGLGDEVSICCVCQRLIDGRPRRNDPYTGRDDIRIRHTGITFLHSIRSRLRSGVACARFRNFRHHCFHDSDAVGGLRFRAIRLLFIYP